MPPSRLAQSIEADTTVTLGAPKLPLVLPPGETRAGDIVIADIGIPADVIENLEGPRIALLTRHGMRELVTPRVPESHKGDYGRVLIVAGSRGKTGAAHLAAVGALRSGAGLVTVATPASCQAVVATMGPEYMTEALDELDGGRRTAGIDPDVRRTRARDGARRHRARPGPGPGRRHAAVHPALVDRATMPLVIDADGLNAFSEHPDRLAGREGRDVIITPHPGEMARLVGMSTDEVQASRLEIARNFAVAHRVYVVLKGHRTLIATPDERVFINPTGNPGMATGGTGDVLTGMIAAWLAQLLDAEAACKIAVYLHGMAGDLAEADEGEVAMTSADLAGHIGDAILELTARRKVVDRNNESTSADCRQSRHTRKSRRPLRAAIWRRHALRRIGRPVVRRSGSREDRVRSRPRRRAWASRRRRSAARRSRSCRSIGAAGVPLFHVDLYRLNDPREIDDLGLEEIAAERRAGDRMGRTAAAYARLMPSASGLSTQARRAADNGRGLSEAHARLTDFRALT